MTKVRLWEVCEKCGGVGYIDGGILAQVEGRVYINWLPCVCLGKRGKERWVTLSEFNRMLAEVE